MRNPFRFGGAVSTRHFCGRERELERITSAVDAERPVFISGPRRSGRSSLLRVTGERLSTPARAVVGVDAWALHREGSLTRALGRVLSEAEAALEGCAASASGPRAVVLMDNAAPALELAGERFRAALREAIESPNRIAWVFVLDDAASAIFPAGDGAAPMRGGAAEITTGPIPFPAWLPFVLERFLETNRWIGNEHTRTVWEITGGQPYHTQHLLHAVWELCEEDGRVDEALLSDALDLVLDREGHGWASLWKDLTPNQRGFLRSAALEEGANGVRPFGEAFLERAGLGSASSSQRAAAALRERRVIGGSDDGYRIRDPMLGAWLRREG